MDSGAEVAPARVSGGRSPPAEAVTAAANPASVGASKMAYGEIMPKVSKTRPTTRTAVSESPPRWKKLSSAPTSGTPRTSAQTAAISCSAGVRSGRPAGAAAGCSACGSGRAARSTLPPAVSGKASSAVTVAGTMCSGSRSARWARSASRSGAGPVT